MRTLMIPITIGLVLFGHINVQHAADQNQKKTDIDALRVESNIKRLCVYVRIYALRNKKAYPPDLITAITLNRAPDRNKLLVDAWGNAVVYHGAGRTYTNPKDPRVLITAGPDKNGKYLVADIKANTKWVTLIELAKLINIKGDAQAKEDDKSKQKDAEKKSKAKQPAKGKEDSAKKDASKSDAKSDAKSDTKTDENSKSRHSELVKRNRTIISLLRLRSAISQYSIKNRKRLPQTLELAIGNSRNGNELLKDTWGNSVRYYGAGRKFDPFIDKGPLLVAGPNNDGKLLVMRINGQRHWISQEELKKRLTKHKIKQ